MLFDSDNLTESQTLTHRLDDWVSPDSEMARLSQEALDKQRLSQRLDDWVSPEGEIARLGEEALERHRATHQMTQVANPPNRLLPEKGGESYVELYHGTSHPKDIFDNGIDVTKGGGQLYSGFYMAFDREVAEDFIEWSSRQRGRKRLRQLLDEGKTIDEAAIILRTELKSHSRTIVKIRIPRNEFDALNIKYIREGTDEYNAFTRNWLEGNGRDIILPEYEDILRSIIDEYDAIIAPIQNMEPRLQIKFDRRIQDKLNRWPRTIEELPR